MIIPDVEFSNCFYYTLFSTKWRRTHRITEHSLIFLLEIMLNRFALCSVARLVLGPVHADAFSKVCVFVVFENASIDSRPHYRFDAFSNVHTKTFENDRIKRFNVCACPSMPGYNPRGRYDVIIFIFMRFRQSTLIRYVSMRFRFDPPSRAFSNRCVFDENAQRISVDGKPKRIDMHAFSKRKRSFLDRVLFISLYKRCFFFSLCWWPMN